MKKILMFLLILALMTACLSMPALAASVIVFDSARDLYDYWVFEKGYDVSLNGNTLKLGSNISLDSGFGLKFDSPYGEAEQVIIDLNGKTLSGDVPRYDVLRVECGTLTVTDSSAGMGGRVINRAESDAGALGVGASGVLHVQAGTIQGPFGLIQEGGTCTVDGARVVGVVVGLVQLDGHCVVSAGSLTGGLAALSQNGGESVILGGVFQGEFYGIQVLGGEVFFGSRAMPALLSVNAQYWDGIWAVDTDIYMQNIQRCEITGGRYGIHTQNGNIVFDGVDTGFVKGPVAAVMIEAQAKRNIRFAGGSSIAFGSTITQSFLGRDNAVCTSVSTQGALLLRSWSDRGAAAQELPSGTDRLDFGVTLFAPFINGYTDGTFRPEGRILRSEAAAMFARVAGQEDITKGTDAFRDVTKGAWYAPHVAVMAGEGVIQGYADRTFRPGNNITRAEFVTMVCRLLDRDTDEAEAGNFTPYTDVFGHWAFPNLQAAFAAGWLDDFTGKRFEPNRAISRGEAVCILVRAFQRDKADFYDACGPFSDVPGTHPLYDFIRRAASYMI